MHDALIYMVTYEGQWNGKTGESPYTWIEYSWSAAESLKQELEDRYPDRVWSIVEKDVS